MKGSEEMVFMELAEMFRMRQSLGVPPKRAWKKRERECDADIIGIGDNGLAAVDRLIEAGFKDVEYLVLHRDEKKLKRTKADALALKDDSWEGIEDFMTAPFETLPKSYQRFWFYYTLNLTYRRPAFVLADFSEADGRDAAPAAARGKDIFSARNIAVVHVPMLETLTDKKAEMARTDLCRRLESLCRYAGIVIAMEDGFALQTKAAAPEAKAKRQSDFVGDLLHSIQGGANAALNWQEAEKFLGISPLYGENLWQAWSSEGADVRTAMEEAKRALSRGGALQKAKRVFVIITGKEGGFSLLEVQDVVDALTAALDEEAQVMLHVNCEKEFADGVRVNMAVRLDAG